MNSRSNQPHATAHIDELQAWAAKSNGAAPVAAKPGASAAQASSALSSVPGPARDSSATGLAPVGRQRNLGKLRDSQAAAYTSTSAGSAAETGTRSSLLPKILIGLGIGVAAYLVISVIIGLLMTMLIILGGAAAIYGAYRVGRWQGRREAR